SLYLKNNNKLDVVNCSGNKLTKLDVGDCINLTELDCSKNLIKNLINLCPKITKLNCSDNQLNDLEIRNCSKLEILDCSDNKLIRLDLSNCSGSIKVNSDNNPGIKNEIKTLLIVGRAGVGKSTLANVLCN